MFNVNSCLGGFGSSTCMQVASVISYRYQLLHRKFYLNGNGIGRMKALNSVAGSLATFLTLSKCLCVFVFLSNVKFSDGFDRLFFKSLGIDGRCLKQRRVTSLADVHGHGCVCTSCLSVFFGLSCWDEGNEAKGNECCPRIISVLISRSLLAQRAPATGFL